MSTIELIASINEILNQAEEDKLRVWYEMMMTDTEEFGNQVIAFDVKGNPMTRLQFNQRIDKAIQEGESGHLISHEEMMEKSKDW